MNSSTASTSTIASSTSIPKATEPNYDESAIPPYELPELMRFADGHPVREAADWPARRREILDVFAREMYGREPPAPEALEAELVDEGPIAAGLGIRRQY